MELISDWMIRIIISQIRNYFLPCHPSLRVAAGVLDKVGTSVGILRFIFKKINELIFYRSFSGVEVRVSMLINKPNPFRSPPLEMLRGSFVPESPSSLTRNLRGRFLDCRLSHRPGESGGTSSSFAGHTLNRKGSDFAELGLRLGRAARAVSDRWHRGPFSQESISF